MRERESELLSAREIENGRSTKARSANPKKSVTHHVSTKIDVGVELQKLANAIDLKPGNGAMQGVVVVLALGGTMQRTNHPNNRTHTHTKGRQFTVVQGRGLRAFDGKRVTRTCGRSMSPPISFSAKKWIKLACPK